jgi:hypothetical protein
MKKILTVHLHFFRNEAHYEFMVVFSTLVRQYAAVQAVVAALFAAFSALLEQERQLVDAMQKSDYTQQIFDADQRVDRCITGMRAVINGALHHFDPAVVAAAQSLYNRFQIFGNITQKTYEEETAAVNLLVAELDSAAYSSKVMLVGLTSWVAELRDAEAAFDLLLNRRNDETAHKPQRRLRDIRHEIDSCYHGLVARISAAATMDDAGAYDEFITKLNADIAYFNEHSHHHAKHDLQHAAVDEIPGQPFAGKPTTPIPTVRYTDSKGAAVELAFAKDFTLTYKDNNRVGTAEVIIHGKGAYKGKKAVTFNITG